MKMLLPSPSARLPLLVEQDRPGVGVERLHRLLGHDHVEIVVRLGARREHRGRGAAHRGGDDLGAVAIELGALGERQRQHFDHDVGPGMVPALVADGVDAAADPLADPPVADRAAADARCAPRPPRCAPPSPSGRCRDRSAGSAASGRSGRYAPSGGTAGPRRCASCRRRRRRTSSCGRGTGS